MMLLNGPRIIYTILSCLTQHGIILKAVFEKLYMLADIMDNHEKAIVTKS